MSSERRRAPRVPADLWVMVEGLDDAPIVRKGDFSVSGVMFDAGGLQGQIGGVEFLHLATPDREVSVRIMARQVRTLTIQQAGSDPRVGVAFEYFVQTEEEQDALLRMFRRFTELRMKQDGAISHRFGVEVEGAPEKTATVFELAVTRLTVEVSWPIQVGERVQLAFRAMHGDARVPFEGVVTRVEPSPDPQGAARYLAHVSVGSAGVRTAPLQSSAIHGSLTESIDLVFSDLSTGDLGGGGGDESLAGDLSRVPLPSLLGLMDMERMTGKLTVHLEGERVGVYVREGTIVDVDPVGPDGPRARLGELVADAYGKFTFEACDVDREDRVQTPTSALLIDLAREYDETHRFG